MKFAITVLLLLFFITAVFASRVTEVHAGDKSYDYVKVSRFISNYDGDTVTVDIHAWPPILGDAVKLRIGSIDTPEMHGKCTQEKVLARKAKNYVNYVLTNAKQVTIRNWKRGTFFRVVADIDVDGVDLGFSLISKGYARSYIVKEGRKSWCE